MDMTRKLELAKQAINMITRADDAPAEEVQAALGDLAKHMKTESVDAIERRKAADLAANGRDSDSGSA